MITHLNGSECDIQQKHTKHSMNNAHDCVLLSSFTLLRLIFSIVKSFDKSDENERDTYVHRMRYRNKTVHESGCLIGFTMSILNNCRD